MNEAIFKKYLATGEAPVPAEDAAPKGWEPDNGKYVKGLLEQHDKRFHPKGFDPEKDSCKFRASLAKGDDTDAALEEAEKEENKSKKDSKDFYNPTDKEIDEAAEAVEAAFDIPKEDTKGVINAVLNGKIHAYIRGVSIPTIAQAMHGKGGVVQAFRERVKGDKILDGHPSLSPEFWEEKDAELALRNKLAKAIGDEYKKDNLEEKTGQTVESFVSQFIDDAKADGFTVSEKSVDVLKQRMDGLKKMEAKAPYEPRFDMSRESLYGYGKKDSSAKDAATLAAAFNQEAEWGFSDEDIQAYIDAFKDMDEGKSPKLPELDGSGLEPPMNPQWSGRQKALCAIFQKRPDLIRPYIIERLTDANFHAEAKELESGAYKKRKTPYNGEEEYKKRNGKTAMDAIDRYLKDVRK